MKESNTRLLINKLLRKSGWILFGDEGKVNVDTETNNESGASDYVLFNNSGFPICVIEAKRKDLSPLVGKEKSRQYANSLRCRFVILSNGFQHFFWDIENGNPQLIREFPSQEQLELRQSNFNPKRDADEKIDIDYIAQSQMPGIDQIPEYIDEMKRDDFLKNNKIRILRNYQLEAVKEVQNAVIRGDDRFLLEMATGTGKTLTSAALIKMFIRLFGVKRVLFLVDRIELESQTKKEFNEVLKNDFSISIWKENQSDWIKSEIIVSTVQSFTRNNKFKKVFRPDSFDLVISDEAHRSLGTSSRKVFEYFIGFKLGLTATPRDYLKSVDINQLSSSNPSQMDRRLLMDTYNTFGCDSGIPTFRYSLKDGVNDGFLLNPKVIDARTEITTQLLSDEGYVIECKEEEEGEVLETIFQKDFEKKFFSENTNAIFCETFIKNAMRDPYTGLIGKTLIFCVSQKHASKITNLLNIYADKLLPDQYHSDFAMQVTSDIGSESQDMTVDFRNNKLSGLSKINPYYLTSQTRVCVTVGMMTTGYDCSDILNICMMRPIFSPVEFIQMKGRGTRRHDFREGWMSKDKIPIISSTDSNKNKFFLFDFFGNYEFFEEKFDYDEKLTLTSEPSGISTPRPGPIIDEFVSNISDPLTRLKETLISDECMRIDRDIYPTFKKKVIQDRRLNDLVLNDDFDLAEDMVKNNILNPNEKLLTLENITKSLGLDRVPTIKELLFYAFDYISHIPTLKDCLDEEFDKLENKLIIPEEIYSDAKEVFEAYATDKDFRKILNTKKYAELNLHPSGNAFKNLPKKFKEEIPFFINKNVDMDLLKQC